MSVPVPHGPVLLYDGTCGFCADSVQLVLRHDRAGTLRFAALQGEAGRGIRAAHPELDGVDSMVWFEPRPDGARGRVFTRSAAAIRVARYLGGWWSLARLAAAIPGPVRDAGYDLVALHRHRLRADGPACLVPAPEVRARFLD